MNRILSEDSHGQTLELLDTDEGTGLAISQVSGGNVTFTRSYRVFAKLTVHQAREIAGGLVEWAEQREEEERSALRCTEVGAR